MSSEKINIHNLGDPFGRISYIESGRANLTTARRPAIYAELMIFEYLGQTTVTVLYVHVYEVCSTYIKTKITD